jgi:hypothetical protein
LEPQKSALAPGYRKLYSLFVESDEFVLRIRLTRSVTDLFDQLEGRPSGGGHLIPFVAGRLRDLWPAAIISNLKPKFQQNRGCRRSYSQAYTASFLGLSVAAHE